MNKDSRRLRDAEGIAKALQADADAIRQDRKKLNDEWAKLREWQKVQSILFAESSMMPWPDGDIVIRIHRDAMTQRKRFDALSKDAETLFGVIDGSEPITLLAQKVMDTVIMKAGAPMETYDHAERDVLASCAVGLACAVISAFKPLLEFYDMHDSRDAKAEVAKLIELWQQGAAGVVYTAQETIDALAKKMSAKDAG